MSQTNSVPEPGADLASPLPVDRIRPAYQQVADQLRELILKGSLSPGDRLPVEGALCATFGVSRSTIREALRLLNSDGLIHTVRGVTGGTFVSNADPQRIRDFLETSIGLLSGSHGITSGELLEARDMLEVPAAALAATRRTDEHLAAMRKAIADERAASDRGGRFEHHHYFHLVLLRAAGNRLIDVMTAPVFTVVKSRFLHEPAQPTFWQEVDSDHARVLAAVVDRDPAAAEGAMRVHLDRLRESYASVEERS